MGALAAAPPAPEEAQPRLASLAAVGLAVLRCAAPRTHTTLEGRAFAEVAKKVAHLLPELDDRYLEQYASVLDRRFGPALPPGAVADLAAEVVQDDPLESAVRGLGDLDLDAHVHGRVLHVPGRVGNPEVPALLAIGLAEHPDPVGAWAGTADDWALMIWRRPDVLVVRQELNRPRRWTAYRLGELAGPQSHAVSARRLPPERRTWSSFPGQPLDPTVHELLRAIGLNDPQPPDCPAST